MKPSDKAIEAALDAHREARRQEELSGQTTSQIWMQQILTAAYAAQFQSEDYVGLVKELRKVEPDLPGDRTRWYRNPNGPDAADAIETLLAERDALKAELAAANTRMSKLDFERTAAELDRDAERDTLMVVNAELSVAFKERDDAIVERGKWEAAYKEITDTYVKIEETTVDKLKKVEAERDALAARLAPVDDKALEEIAAHCEATFDGWPFSSLERLSQDVYRVRAHQLLAAIRPHIEAAERERCAKKILETNWVDADSEEIAAAIRSGK